MHLNHPNKVNKKFHGDFAANLIQNGNEFESEVTKLSPNIPSVDEIASYNDYRPVYYINCLRI